MYLRRLETDPLLSTDEEIRRIRSFMLVEDSISKTTPKDLLEKNKHNRMAFEYLTAFLLLTGQHAAVAHRVGYLDNFDYAGTVSRFGKFMQHFQRHKYDLQTAAKTLEEKFGDTYYYFYFFLLDRSELEV